MAQNFRDCIKGRIAEGALTESAGNAVLRKYDELSERYVAGGKTREAAQAAAEALLEREARLVEQRKRNLMQAAMKQQEVNKFWESTPGRGDKKASHLYQTAAYRGERVKETAYAFMNDVAEKIAPNFWETGRDYKTFADGVRHALGETVEGADAAKVGEVIKQVFDYLHARLRSAGGVIGKIDKYFPQVHRKEAIAKVAKDEWVAFTKERLDTARMINERTGSPFTPNELTDVLRRTYDSVVTAGRSEVEDLSKKGKMPPRVGRDLDMRRSESRFLHFKNADAFLDYNRRFGTGDQGLIQAFLGTIDGMSREIGALELMGPRPNAMARFLDFKMRTEGVGPTRRAWVNAQYRILVSRFEEGSVDSAWWKVLTGVQGWLRSAMLGSASISALSDTSFILATAKVNGLSASRAMTNYLAMLAPGANETKALARRSGFLVDIINGSTLADTRFAGEAMNAGFTRWLAGLTNKLSGLGAMTRATKDSIALEGMATLGDHLAAKTPWEKLDADLTRSLGKFGVTKDDWADLYQAKLASKGQTAFLVTSDLRVDTGLDAGRAKELADKLDDWVASLRQAASNEATLATRALTTGAILGDGAGGPGTVSRAFASSLGMFKSFPITVIMTHLIPAFERAKVHRKLDHLAIVTVGTTLLGALAMQLKDLSKGKTGRDMDNYKFWQAAFLQGGGMGLFGDFFLGDYSRFGRNPLTELGGPLAGLVEDSYSALKGNLDKGLSGEEPSMGRDLFRVAKRNIPLGSLWYGRVALERVLLDNLERLVDPKFDRRMRKLQRKIQKESGQEFWWAPGEMTPGK